MPNRSGRPLLALLAALALLPATTAPAETIITQEVKLSVETLVRGLDHPWAIEILPDGAILLTERPGSLRIFHDGKLSDPIAGLPKLYARNQGGLLDVAVSPDFALDATLFFTASQRFDGGVGISVFSARGWVETASQISPKTRTLPF